VVTFLQSYENIDIEIHEFVKGRSNLILKYNKEMSDRTLAIVGSHMDVVLANPPEWNLDPSEWNLDPFKLTVDEDKLYGRGTTDYLGHVALRCLLFKQLAIQKPTLDFRVGAVLIADEESGFTPEVGVIRLYEQGYLDLFKNGPHLLTRRL
jgi:acetylornithine deacetylase